MTSLRRAFAPLLLLLCVVVSTSMAWAFTPPPITGHVTDTAGKLTSAERLALDHKLEDYRRCSGHEIAVLIVASLGGETIEDVAYTTFNTWKIGRAKEDDGVLLVIAPAERRIRIETGKGIGGSLTDLESSHINRDTIGPRLKQNDFFGAVDQGTTAIGKAIGGCAMTAADAGATHTPAPLPRPAIPPPRTEGEGGVLRELAFADGFLSLLGFMALVIYGAVRDKTIFAALPFAVIAGTLAAGIVGSISESALLPVLGANAGFLGVFVPLWRYARRKHGGPWRPASGGGGGEWSSSESWSSSSSDIGSSGSSGGSGYTDGGSSYTGGGGESGGGGSSDSY